MYLKNILDHNTLKWLKITMKNSSYFTEMRYQNIFRNNYELIHKEKYKKQSNE